MSGGYAVELDDMRDPRQTPLALPINMCDESRVDVRVADWDDGMRTLKYRPVEAGREEEGKGILKHVFTCNSQELQWEATPLFAQIQREVCLSKKIGDSGERELILLPLRALTRHRPILQMRYFGFIRKQDGQVRVFVYDMERGAKGCSRSTRVDGVYGEELWRRPRVGGRSVDNTGLGRQRDEKGAPGGSLCPYGLREARRARSSLRERGQWRCCVWGTM